MANDEVELISLLNSSYSHSVPKYKLRIDTITEFQGKCILIFFIYGDFGFYFYLWWYHVESSRLLVWLLYINEQNRKEKRIEKANK